MSDVQAKEIHLSSAEQAQRQYRLKVAVFKMENYASTKPDLLITSHTELEAELERRFDSITEADGFVNDVDAIELLATCVEDGIMLGTTALKIGNLMVTVAQNEIDSVAG